MVQRINISVPDDLAERLESFKGRFNVSGTCARALMAECDLMEAIDKSETLVENLRAQAEGELDEVYEYGRRRAVSSWGGRSDFDLSLLREMADWGDAIREQGWNAEYAPWSEEINDQLERWNAFLIDHNSDEGRHPPSNREMWAYHCGVLAGTSEFWDGIREDVEG